MGFKAGFLGLIGQPNAGKSTLMNWLVAEKVSIVTAKPQTTRRRILGIWSTDAGQVVFVDAPGIIEAEKGLNGFLAKEAQDVISSSDALIAVLALDETKPEACQKVVDMVAAAGKPWIGVITKTDIEDKAHRILILKQMIESKNGKAFSVSVVSSKDDQDEREAFLIECLEMMPASPAPLFDVDLFTSENIRDMVSEIIREKLFEHLHHEIPFEAAVRVARFEEDAKPCPKIYAEILVSKDSHKPIVVGKDARVIKSLGMESRKEIEKIMGEKVFLDLQVLVREDWFDNSRMMKELKYVTGTRSNK